MMYRLAGSLRQLAREDGCPNLPSLGAVHQGSLGGGTSHPSLCSCFAAERNAISRLLHKAGCGPFPLVTFAKQPAQVFEGKVRGVCPQQGVWDPAGQSHCWGSGAQCLQKESC